MPAQRSARHGKQPHLPDGGRSGRHPGRHQSSHLCRLRPSLRGRHQPVYGAKEREGQSQSSFLPHNRIHRSLCREFRQPIRTFLGRQLLPQLPAFRIRCLCPRILPGCFRQRGRNPCRNPRRRHLDGGRLGRVRQHLEGRCRLHHPCLAPAQCFCRPPDRCIPGRSGPLFQQQCFRRRPGYL